MKISSLEKSVTLASISKFLTAVALLTLPAVALSGPTKVAENSGSLPTEASPLKAVRPQITVDKRSPGYWRVTFDIPPFNIFGPETIPQMEKVVTEIETDPNLRVVVFDSAVPGYFLTHYNFTPPLVDSTKLPAGRTGLHPLPDMLVRISKAPVVSIALISRTSDGCWE